MTKCPYRADKKCNGELDDRYGCSLCLLGQQIDEISLINSAIGNLTASIEERLCNEKIASASRLVICTPKTHDEHCDECKHAKPHTFSLGNCDEVCFFSGHECREEQK